MLTPLNIYFPGSRRCGIRKTSTPRGRIGFTASKGLPGVGFTRREWNAIKDLSSGTVTRTILETTLPTCPLERVMKYTASFTLQSSAANHATVRAKLNALEQH